VTRPRSGTFVAAGARERAMLLLEQTPLSTIPTPRTWSTRRGHLLRQAGITQARRIATIYHQTNSQAGDKTPCEEAIHPSVRCSQGCAEAARERGADIGFALHDGTEKRHQSVLQWLKTTHPGGVLIIQRSDSFRQFHEIVDPMLARGTPVVNLFGDVQG